MSQYLNRIKNGLVRLSEHKPELLIGKVKTLNEATGMMTIDTGISLIENVSFKLPSGDESSIVIIPETGSEVLIGNVDGPGLWALIKCTKVAKIQIQIGNTSIASSGAEIELVHGATELRLNNHVCIKNASGSLATLLKQLLQQIQLITVTTPSGLSGPPVNALAFSSISTQLDLLLTE